MTHKFLSFVTLLALCLMASLSYGQEVSAGITGRVTDPSGGAIVGASITARDVTRGTEWQTKSNEDGIYVFPRVPPSTYELKVESKGFKTYIQSNIILDVNMRARIDPAMQVGGLTETVTITGEGAILQTDTTQVGAVITSKTIVNMPLISRNPVALSLLAPGVVTANPADFNSGVRTGGGGRPYVNGNRKESNNFLLDGIDNNQISDNLTSYQPNLDAIAEIKMITNNASAEFGNFQGVIMNVIIKSGANQMHGSVFEYFRNNKMNANNWARNWTLGADGKSLPRTALRWNQYGGTVGGAIKKDKIFYFADFQALRKATPTSISSTTIMPTTWRNGDFSRLLTDAKYAGGSAIQLYNPFSTLADGTRSPFPNNQIPVSSFSPVITKLFANTALYPTPTVADSAVSLASTANYFYGSSSQVNSDQGDFKLDWKVTDKDDFSARYSNGRQDQPGHNTAPFLYDSFNIAPFQNGVLNWTRTITPTLVNEARFGINNIMLNNGGADKGQGDAAAALGIANAGSGLLSLQGFTFISSLGNANIGTQQLFANTTWHWADNLTIIRGRHMMKTGGQVLRQQMNTYYSGNNGRNGYIGFNGQYSAVSSANPKSAKLLSEADFLLGLPSSIGRGPSSGTWGHRKTIFGFYFQDDWRVTNHLTLNLGLRWEYHTPLVEVKDRQSNFEPFTGKLQLAGQDGNSRALYNGYKKDFQPRIGFAYTLPGVPGDKVVIRGAYTVSSFMEGSGTNLRLTMNPPFNSEYQSDYNTSAFALPTTNLAAGLSGLNSKDPYKGATIRLWDPNVRPANTQQWNFTVETQLPANNVLSVAYVGQHGTHLIVPMAYNQKQLINGVVTPSPYLAGNPLVYGDIISGTETAGNQKYAAMQTTVNRRFSNGFSYQFSYTWSHGMADSIGYYGEGGQAGSQSAYAQNVYDRKSEWGPTYFDVKHAYSSSFVYELPFGHKRKFASTANRALDFAIGGWQLGGMMSGQTGMPLTIKLSSDPSQTTARSYRPNVIGTPNDQHLYGPGNKWLDITAYATPTAKTFGNIGVGTSRGPGNVHFDASLMKQFRVTEAKYFELRGEAFNLSNTPIFASPASQSIASSLFGEIRSAQGDRNIQLSLRFAF